MRTGYNMRNNLAITIEDVSKCYRIKENTKDRYSEYDTLRDSLTRGAKKILRPWQLLHEKNKQKELWALQGIHLEIEKGDKLGIIGNNGAGKSTLLKILSQITEPTTGRVSIRGRITSLLEVGTGFHPELTGRENIYLNGAILGMNKQEIGRHFDEIVDFAGVETFLEVPLKRYSSGMAARLGFSVAAHLESDIMIIDEALAVGDMEFQQKCIQKMNAASKNEGKTILFVSHNIKLTQQLCNKGILLNQGKLIHVGDIESTASKYVQGTTGEAKYNIKVKHREDGIEVMEIKPCTSMKSGEDWNFHFKLKIDKDYGPCFVDTWIHNNEINPIIHIPGLNSVFELNKGILEISVRLNTMQLNIGDYMAGLYISTNLHRTALLDISHIKIASIMETPSQVHSRSLVSNSVEVKINQNAMPPQGASV